ncbi:hypothetical protein SAMN05421640_0009 [Ekhidna lutea]|uniref:Lipoprotein n=1 Tax=Ekhidna lutea TaxID=447679 RepID=A0A239MEU1_EKHLU|nr:hypothetical protein [Ekhidna lutea]SNT40652.1 hypothetical protein SAMN05421640_0009 [Ekhidna lutea]
MFYSKSVILILIATACSPKAIPFDEQYNNNTECECQSNEQNDHSTSLDIWKKYENHAIRREHFNSLKKEWELLNDPPLGYYSDYEFRFTELATFGTGKTIRVFLKDSTATFMLRELDKDLIVINMQFRTKDYWSNFNKKLDSLFWNQPFDSQEMIAVMDGSTYYFEGFTPEREHAIYRYPRSEYQDLMEQFYLPLIIHFNCKSSKKKQLDCR